MGGLKLMLSAIQAERPNKAATNGAHKLIVKLNLDDMNGWYLVVDLFQEGNFFLKTLATVLQVDPSNRFLFDLSLSNGQALAESITFLLHFLKQKPMSTKE